MRPDMDTCDCCASDMSKQAADASPASTGVTEDNAHLLGIGLLQKSAPELSSFCRVDKHQLIVFDWQTVVDHHVHPLAKLPELQTARQNTHAPH